MKIIMKMALFLRFDPYNREIIGTWNNENNDKFAVRKDSMSTQLRINRLAIRDMGVYRVQVQNSYDIKEVDFTLNVLSTKNLKMSFQC